MIEVRISFPLNIFRKNSQKFTKFYIFIYFDKNEVGIVSCHFLLISDLPHLIDVRISFPLYTFRTNRWNFTNFFIYMYAFILARPRFGILIHHFHKFLTD